MTGLEAYVLAKNIAISAVSGVKDLTVDGTKLLIETNDGNTLEMDFPVPSGIDKGYFNSVDGKMYKESTFENEIAGKLDVIYIDRTQNRLCFWDGEKFNAAGGSITVGDINISSLTTEQLNTIKAIFATN